MKKLELKINGKPEVLGGPPPKAKRVIDFIKSLKGDEFWDRDGLRTKLSISDSVIRDLNNFLEEIDGHYMNLPSTNNNKRMIYGPKAGISKLKKQLEIEDSE